MGASGLSALQRSLKFRELVGLVLRGEGLNVTHKPGPVPLSRSILDEEHSHIRGLPGWSVLVRHEATRDLSGALDAAMRAAASDSKDKAAVVWRRHESERTAGESYVVMSLQTFAAVLRDELERVR